MRTIRSTLLFCINLSLFNKALAREIFTFALHFNTDLQSSKMTSKGPQKVGRLSKTDPNSFSNPEDVRAENIHFKWNLDFDKRKVTGSATYDIVAKNSSVQHMIFDTRDIKIKSITDFATGSELKFSLGESVTEFGGPLSVNLPSLNNENRGVLNIVYECSPDAPALKWLPKEQTLMKKYPYMFAKGYMRSLFPCQDTSSTKATYTAEVTAMKEVEVLMSAVKSEEPVEINGNQRLHKFEQKIPIPSHLVTVVAGDIQSKVLGPRSHIWAEKDDLETAAFDFSETEKVLQVGEQLFGEFVWSIYDILVLPPSFPVGGMEFPCLTFLTPSALTGDKSLAQIITHEICHSWFGNLVTNTSYEHFWLNEGFAVFAERKILSVMSGSKASDFDAIGGWKDLAECIKSMKPDNPLTHLVPDLTGVSPADAFSVVPYEKGYTFLRYLEGKVGGSGSCESFLRHYILKNQYKSIDTNTFKSQFIDFFTDEGKVNEISDIDWDGWLYSPGMPLVKLEYDTSLADMCTELKTRWVEWKTSDPCPFKKDDLKDFSMPQIIEFVAQLLGEDEQLGKDKIIALQNTYDFHSFNNSEVKYRWLTLCIKNRWLDAVPLALKFVSENGRMKLIRPIYEEMYSCEEIRQIAIDNFKKVRPSMMHQSARCVALALKLE